jgi:flagellar motility protein MotE (MotC chaperone)
MWLSGNATPNFRTINNFRGQRLKGKIQRLFAELVRLMAEMGYVSLDIQYIDGTKIEAASNKYSFVWKGSVEKNKAKLEEKIKAVLNSIDTAIDDDHKASDQPELKEINSDELHEKIEQLNAKLATLNKKEQKRLKTLEEDHLPRLLKYEQLFYSAINSRIIKSDISHPSSVKAKPSLVFV